MFSQDNPESDKVTSEGRIDPSYVKRKMFSVFSGNLCCIVVVIIMTLMPLFTSFGSFGYILGVGNEIFLYIALGIVGIVVAILVYNYFWVAAYVRNFSYQITATNIIIQQGVFSKRRDSIPFSRIQNISIKSGFFDRMFKLSSVQIETAGSSGAVYRGRKAKTSAEGYIPGQKEPEIIEKLIREMVQKHGSSGGT